MARHLLIVFHSQSGSSERLAHAAARGAREEPEIDVRLLRAWDAGVTDLRWCDALILATPENFGFMSGAMNDFLARTFYPALDLALNIPYALLISAGNDGTGAVRQMQKILQAYPMRQVAEPLIVKGEPQDHDLDAAREAGLALAAGLGLGIF
jgi:multimeric flavodoxin WrbA